MGSILATLAMLYGGWKNWSWWSPVYALLILTPMTVIGLIISDRWRLEAGLSQRMNWSNLPVYAAVELTAFFIAFALARGLRHISRR